MENEAQAPKSFWKGGLFLVLFLTSIVYMDAMWRSELLNWDDDLYLLENEVIKGENGFYKIWIEQETPNPYPITFSVIRLQYLLFGEKSFPFHVVNLLLHLLNIVLLWLLIKRLGIGGFGQFFTVSIYALHPVQVETVMWMSEVKNLLCSVFYWLSFFVFFRVLESKGKKRALNYFLLVFLFLASLLSKSMAVTLPVSFSLWIFFFCKDSKLFLLLLFLPFWFISLGIGYLSIEKEKGYLESYGAKTPDRPLEKRVTQTVRGIYFYVCKFFWPEPLMPIYPKRFLFDNGTPAAWFFVILLFLWVLFLFVAPWYTEKFPKLASFTLLNYGIVASPVLGFFTTSYMPHSLYADRYNYHSLPFMVLGLGMGLQALWERLPKKGKEWGGFAFALILCALCFQTFRYSQVWTSSFRLWKHTAEHNHEHHGVLGYLGKIYWEREEVEIAGKLFRLSLTRLPNVADEYENYGVYLAREGKLEEALNNFKASINYFGGNGAAHGNIAALYLQIDPKKNIYKAIEHYEKAISAKKPDRTKMVILGNLYWETQQWEKAKECFEKAIKEDINIGEAYLGLALFYEREKQIEKAEGFFKKAVELNSEDPSLWLNCYYFYYNHKKYEKAASLVQEAFVILDKDYKEAKQKDDFKQTDLEENKFLELYIRLRQEYISLLLFCPDDSFRSLSKAIQQLEVLREVVENTPISTFVLEMYAITLSQNNEHLKALQVLTEALEKASLYRQNQNKKRFIRHLHELRVGLSLSFP